jgi:hypothetical protein
LGGICPEGRRDGAQPCRPFHIGLGHEWQMLARTVRFPDYALVSGIDAQDRKAAPEWHRKPGRSSDALREIKTLRPEWGMSARILGFFCWPGMCSVFGRDTRVWLSFSPGELFLTPPHPRGLFFMPPLCFRWLSGARQ